MASQITVSGIRVPTITLNFKEGEPTITGSYELISSGDKVLAKQGFNGYSDLKYVMSPAAVAALDAFRNAVKADLSVMLGFDPN